MEQESTEKFNGNGAFLSIIEKLSFVYCGLLFPIYVLSNSVLGEISAGS